MSRIRCLCGEVIYDTGDTLELESLILKYTDFEKIMDNLRAFIPQYGIKEIELFLTVQFDKYSEHSYKCPNCGRWLVYDGKNQLVRVLVEADLGAGKLDK